MASRSRPDFYNGAAPPRSNTRAPPTLPPHQSQALRAQAAGEAARARALEGIPRVSERPSAPAAAPVRLSADEKRVNDERATIFSLIMMADRLERVFIDDLISVADYEATCRKLIQQFSTARKTFERSVPDMNQFVSDYRCNAAHGISGYARLVSGIPATMEHGVQALHDPKRLHYVHACTEAFISLIDTLELGSSTAEQLSSLVIELRKALSRVEGLPAEYAFKTQIGVWAEKLGSMHALAALSDHDLADLRMQLVNGYQEYSDSFRT